MDNLEDEYAIGLDLGTTFSCIGVYKDGKVEIIPNSIDEKITPSIVILTKDSNILVGEDTIEFLVQYYDSCIYEIKRLIGRKFSDKDIKKEIKKLPFNVINLNDGSPGIEININGIPIRYNPVEISSFIIKKMVHNAENYLKKKITKLVITVPAYFNDSQRKLTKQAAELVGLKVLRIINEPTAAALAYGFDNKEKISEKILVFDLGGGTFDVSILSVKIDINNNDYKSFQVLGTSGDTQLGGEDFDNQLVEYFLSKIDNGEKIKENKQLIKKLKIHCEIIKKKLSSENEATLQIDNFDEKMNINEKITRKEFEDICEDLFRKLDISIENALINAKLTKYDIQEIILVGGSTRIPKVKEIVRNYFPESKINETTNPDEAVAFGATIDAEKILHNKDSSISNFVLLDVIPLSLGTNIQNNYKEKKILDEGNLMSVIIKRGTIFPTSQKKQYSTIVDNQKNMSIDIYEGEYNFVKYNHLLKKSSIKGLTERPKGKTKVVVTFSIDINGILTILVEEESENNDGKKMELTIKNDEISLDPTEIEKLKNKNENLIKKLKHKDLSGIKDYNNLKATLKKYKDAYNKCKDKQNKDEDDDDDDDDGAIYKINFNNTLEKFIDSFGTTFDNETLFEKYFFYVKELFLSYIETLTLEIEKDDINDIISKIKKYIKIFIEKSLDYLNTFVEIFHGLENIKKGLKKKKKEKLKIIFYQIVIFVMEKLNEYGKNKIFSEEKFCKYYSLNYFELAKTYYERYLSKIEEAILEAEDMNKLNNQKNECYQYIKDINSGAILLCLASFEGGYLFDEDLKSNRTGKTNQERQLLLSKNLSIEEQIERYNLVLSNYVKILSEILSSNEYQKNTIKEAICIANIIKINKILGKAKRIGRILLRYAERCQFIIERQENQSFNKDKWYLEFNKLYDEIKKYDCNKKDDKNYRDLLYEVKKNNEDLFNKIDEKFNKKKDPIDFINYILEKHPYKDYQKDKDILNGNFFKNYNMELILFLLGKYQPDNYTKTGDENIKLNYCIVHEIEAKLSNLFQKINN